MVVAHSRHALVARRAVVALLPCPNKLIVEPAARAHRGHQLVPCAEAGPSLLAMDKRLEPSRVRHAAAQAQLRVAANANLRYECPSELEAGEG